MGAIQQATADMLPYSTEIHSESFRLTAAGPQSEFQVRRVGRNHLGVPAADVSKIVAALDRVMAHRTWREWDGTRRRGVMMVRLDGDRLVIRTVTPVYAEAWDDENGSDAAVSVEIEYADVESFRARLLAAR